MRTSYYIASLTTLLIQSSTNAKLKLKIVRFKQSLSMLRVLKEGLAKLFKFQDNM